MKITKITIKNYRSIKEVPFDISVRDDGSFTYGLIGINEAGKSSILKAIGLKDGLVDESGTKLPLPKDFRSSDNIEVTYQYGISLEEDRELYDILNKENPASVVQNVGEAAPVAQGGQTQENKDNTIKEAVKTKNKFSAPLTVKYNRIFYKMDTTLKYSVLVLDGVRRIEIVHSDEFNSLVHKNAHKTIFWTAEDRYLISKAINIEQFTNDKNISIPLRNCFLLSSIKEGEIKQRLSDALGDTTECEHLENTLGENVTAHIQSAWRNHPIRITFKIMDGHINFHVKDIDTKGKAQTSDMRSDGFKQFVSFLLTIVAENKNEELRNTILLLDEPETHLHPKAQEYLLTQLKEITNNNKNNIVLFATHSNYMIDKKDLSRCYRVEKKKDEQSEEHTHASQFDKKQTSYAEVSYEVFDILDEQYHNELYDKLRDWFVKDKNSKESDVSKHTDTIGVCPFDEQYFKQIKKIQKSFQDTSKPTDIDAKVTLPTFIRNCIHYPANKKSNFDEKLKESIDLLRDYLRSDIISSEKSSPDKSKAHKK